MRHFNPCVIGRRRSALPCVAASLLAACWLLPAFESSNSALAEEPPAKSDGDKPAATPAKNRASATWDLAGWHTVTDNPFNYTGAPEPDTILVKEKKLLDGSIIVCGIGVGPKAASKDDQQYKTYFDTMSKHYHGGLPRGQVVKPVPLTINGVEYQNLYATGPDIIAETLVGIENGICVSYWYNGPVSELKGFHAGVGKAKISFETAKP